MKKLLFTSLIILVIAAGCRSKSDDSKNTEGVIPVTVMQLQQTRDAAAIAVSGQFTTDDETYLSFKTGGVVKSVYVREGQFVKKGQLLATLELNEIESQVSQAKLGHEKAVRDFNRVSNLYKDSVATQSQMQDAKTGLDVATQQLAIANYNLKYSEIHAVREGYILKRFVNDGQLVGPGTPVLQTNGAGSGNWILKAAVSDREWAAIRNGDKASVTTDIADGKKITGAVLRKSEGTDPYTGTFSVDIKVNSAAGITLASGMFGKAEIMPEQKMNIWKIPFDALLDGDKNTGYVFVTDDGKTARKQQVKIAAFTKDYVAVYEGLEHSSSLIVTGNAYLTDRAAITITERK